METPLPEYLSLDEHYASYRPLGEVTLDKAVEMVNEAILFCRRNGIRGMLINLTRISGFPPPSMAERFMFIKQWAETAGGQLVVSMVAPPEMIDPDKIGITMAGNRGLFAEVFTDEADAIEWLISKYPR
jgi:hypothetical protein